MELIFVLLLSYIAGSFPSAWIMARLLGAGDIRKLGSGNSGATNVLRELGWKAALPVLIVDAGKGAASVLLIASAAQHRTETLNLPGVTAAIGAMLGHAFPPWLGFRGGKAVATGAAAIAALEPFVALFCLIVFIIVVAAGRYVSLASMAAAFSIVPFYFLVIWMRNKPIDLYLLSFFIAATMLVFILHKSNIVRLVRGTERKLGPIRALRRNT